MTLQWSTLFSSIGKKTLRLFLLNKERILESCLKRRFLHLLGFGLLAIAAPIAVTQSTPRTATLDLPDSPGALRSATYAADYSSSSSSLDAAPSGQITQHTRTASRWDTIILPGEQAPSLTAKDKFLMGARDSVTPFSAIGWIASAGWSHLTNGPPNYGTDKGAFGQRLGAAAIRDTSEDVFSTSMAGVLHEDPRYYKLGRSHSITKRVIYAATRAIITRTDSGSTTPNFALISGNLAGAALTNAYYPPLNHGAKQTMIIFGGSMGGSALGFGVSEFLGDALQLMHLKKSE
jgi:hypothetical protein